MISVMRGDCEFDRISDASTEQQIEAKPRVSDDNVIGRSNKDENLLKSGVDEEVRLALESERSEVKVRVRASSEIGNDCNSRDVEMESESFVAEENKVSVNQIDRRRREYFEAGNDRFDEKIDRVVSNFSSIEGHGEAYNSLLSEFDDFVANEKMLVGTYRALSYGFEVGDMVWGKVKSHPWWPGHIFNESFASSMVRRTRSDGHVLVAFFGDSSYGWFDPAELIPFDLNYAEKSQQTNARSFVRAVEEAVDEASRRCGLGLVCKCRNPYNFRPTNVQGYFTVDVPDFEPGGLYSANQIKKARDGFRPAETLSFVKQLASAPRGCEQMSIDFIKNKATVFAFRKAVFEEFDETYAQAFGVQPARPSRDRAALLDQCSRQPTRAPLSGPMVYAEALGGGKKKPMKVKDHSKKDKYLFKRRDEPGDLKTYQISQGQEISLSPSPVMDGLSTLAAGDYVLQKRAPGAHMPVKVEETGFISNESSGLSRDASGKDTATIDHTSAFSGNPTIQVASVDVRSSPGIHAMKERVERGFVPGSTSGGGSDMLEKVIPGLMEGAWPSSQQEDNVMVDIKNEESVTMSRSKEGYHQSEPNFSARGEGDHGLDQVQDSRPSIHPLPIDAKHSVGVSPDGKIKKPEALKRPLVDMSSPDSMGEPKKKKKKMDLGLKAGSGSMQKQLAIGKGGTAVGKVSKKSSQVGLASRENSRVINRRKDVGDGNSMLTSVTTMPAVSIENIEGGLPQLLNDLHALALDPFHGVERNCPAIIRQCFMRFRSLVYQKSLVLSPPSDTEPFDFRSAKSSSSVAVPGENVRDLPASKPVKHLARPDDPTKAGRKHPASDRQEEIAAKRLKKISLMKSLTTEKKSGQRTSDGQRSEGKEHVTIPPAKLARPDTIKKLGHQARSVEPTMLVMKFPPGTSLPSAAELKARFGRFGSIDQSAIRVFWKSSTCRVVFRYKADAQAAYKYANGNNALFGNVNVRYIVREVEAPAAEALDTDKGRGDEPPNENPRVKDPMLDRPTQSPLLQPMIQLKSCLKKPSGDEAGQVTGSNGSRGTARVKFMLGGEESSRTEPLMVGNRNNFNNNATSFADGGASSSVAMDFNSKNFQKVIIPPFSSPIPPSPQFAKPQFNNSHHTEVVAAPRNSHNLNTPTAPPPTASTPTIDISQQMLSLLTRCNDVVTNVTGLLGYVPYHPL
ncbi:uncharacterized protein LOC123208451 [Mangifera indica]|uniref:uncharacterized protein LOC123208451 n=1 Tax=Mangifera indica TaxID=29780 RepID=UPI001CFB1FF8|nr:uncharacterized protein LOC123208451 [Mangifera indica]